MQRLRKRNDREILRLLSFRYANAGSPGSVLNSLFLAYARLTGLA